MCKRNLYWIYITWISLGQNNQEYRLNYWATCSSVCFFARTAHSFACSTLCASLALRCAHWFARSLTHSLTSGKMYDLIAILPAFFFCADHGELEWLLKNRALPLFSLLYGGSFHCPNPLETLNEFCLDVLEIRSTPSLDTTFQ